LSKSNLPSTELYISKAHLGRPSMPELEPRFFRSGNKNAGFVKPAF